MSDQDALLAAIRANPDDDTPRLIYADWFDEHLPDAKPSPAAGPSARAEYIRVQCRLAQHPYDEPDYPELLEREEELAQWLTAHARDAERVDVHSDLERNRDFSFGDDADYRRGFPEEVEFTDYDEEPEENIPRITAALEDTFAKTTARTLRLDDVYGAEVEGVAAHPVAAQLRGLMIDFVADDEESRAARGVAESPHLTGLRRLNLSCNLDLYDVRALARSGNFEHLEEMTVENCSPDGFKALAGARWFRNLRRLRYTAHRREEFRGLSELPPMPNLVRLEVIGRFEPSGAAFRRFTSGESFPKLARLDLECVDLTVEQLKQLARAPWPLRCLRLYEVPVRAAGAEALASAAFADSLRVLELESAQVPGPGVRALAASAALAGLRHLSLSGNPVGASGLAALARSPHLRGLRRLDLGRCTGGKTPIDAARTLAFLSALDLPDLRHLGLSHLPVGVRGARALAGGAFPHLTKLELTACGLRETGARALVESGAFPHLTHLSLGLNNAGKGLEKLASAKTFPKLGQALLGDNRLPKPVRAKLAKRPGVEVWGAAAGTPLDF